MALSVSQPGVLTCVGPVSSNLKALNGMHAAGPATDQLPYMPGSRMVVSSACRLRSSQCCRSLEPCRHKDACTAGGRTMAFVHVSTYGHPEGQHTFSLMLLASKWIIRSLCVARTQCARS